MVRSIIFISALFAIISFAYAAPAGQLVNVNAGYIGTGDINIEDILNEFLAIYGLHIEDIAQYIDLL